MSHLLPVSPLGRLVSIFGLCLLLGAASQPPAPAPPEPSQQPEDLPAPENEESENQNAEPEATALATEQPEPQEETPEPPEAASIEQSEPAVGGWTDPLLVLFSSVLAAVGVLQFLIFRETHRMNLAVQRAYVGLSPAPPGLDFSEHAPPGLALELDVADRGFTVTLIVKNHGATPAEVLGISLTVWVSDRPLPEKPQYTGPPVGDDSQFFLMAGEQYNNVWPLSFTKEQLEGVRGGHKVWLIGYVDYRDKFSRKHRGGFARRYHPRRIGNNLDVELKADYNYDTQLSKKTFWS